MAQNGQISPYLGMKFAEVIEEALRRSGVTAREFAERIGMHEGSYQKWRAGANYASPKALHQIKEQFGVDILLDRNTGEARILEFTPSRGPAVDAEDLERLLIELEESIRAHFVAEMARLRRELIRRMNANHEAA